MKIRAGDQLWTRNPSTEPATIRKKLPTNQCGSPGFVSIMMANIEQTIRATPPDNPSMLSRKLNELTRTTNQTTDNTPPTHGLSTNTDARTPAATIAIDTPN